MICHDCVSNNVRSLGVILCPKHASVDRLIEALAALAVGAKYISLRGKRGDLDNFEAAEDRARALLDELKEAQGTQIPETGDAT